jgi:hypothetical protein
MVAFLARKPIFVTRKNRSLNFSVGTIYDLTATHAFDAGELESILAESLHFVRVVNRGRSNAQTFSDLFNILTRFSISNVFLFHSSALPPLPSLPFVLDCLEIVDSFLFNATPIPQLHGVTHCYLSSCRPELIGYLLHLVTDIIPETVRLSVKLSPGIEVVWVCGNKHERQVHCRDMEFEFSQAPSTLAVTFAVHPTAGFNDHATFSVQAVASFSGAGMVVHNRVWRKAGSISEWCDSIDVCIMAAIFIRQQAAHILVPRFLERPYTWEQSGLPRDHGKAVTVAVLVRLFRDLFTVESSVLPSAMRAGVLRFVMVGGSNYTAALIEALMCPEVEPPLLIPPFVLIPEGQAREIAIRVRDAWGMVPVVVQLAAKVFGALEKSLRMTSV